MVHFSFYHSSCPSNIQYMSAPFLSGKSTLLRALAVGVYDKVPGDGREFVVTDPGAVTVRAEDGRPVSDVDISPFISSLPSAATAPTTTHFADTSSTSLAKPLSTNRYDRTAVGDAKQYLEGAAGADAEKREVTPHRERNTCEQEGGDAIQKGGEKTGGERGVASGGEVSTERFSTGAASGSTSQAANVVEALEAGATALLLDEDTCAGNVRLKFGSGLSLVAVCVCVGWGGQGRVVAMPQQFSQSFRSWTLLGDRACETGVENEPWPPYTL